MLIDRIELFKPILIGLIFHWVWYVTTSLIVHIPPYINATVEQAEHDKLKIIFW